jgi:LL-diaminopimelate aminotransferase
MLTRNPGFAALSSSYLFPEIGRRRREFQAAHPEARIISLGVGNTTEPLSPSITKGLSDEARALGTPEGYSGYGDDYGDEALREAIARVLYKGIAAKDEVFISDGAKCDIGRFQHLFGHGREVAIQDPAYPVYVDGSVIQGCSIRYLPCTRENGYFPDLSALPEGGIVYFCSPNNPTGHVATREELSALVAAARRKGCVILFDAAYAEYIADPALPKSIFEIEGARECAIEISSFSKPVGFTGVRLGWSVVPMELKYACGASVRADWMRLMTTVFNGASNIAQKGGIAALSPEGVKEMRASIAYYMENARIIKEALEALGLECEGGANAPYIWARFPGRDSWEVFAELLERCHVVATPGAGFGPSGQSYIRFSAFGHRADVVEACARLGRLGA